MLGRLPHRAGGQRPTAADHESGRRSARRDGPACDFRKRTATRLSGGEQARVLIARALAQETPMILADEPVAGLDPAHQIASMDTLRRAGASGATACSCRSTTSAWPRGTARG